MCFQEQGKLSLESSLASSFQLKPFTDVIVNIVEKSLVTLDSVEMIFKDQYLSRSVMWRMRSSLIDTCVYGQKKVEYQGIRCQVFEMWCLGVKMASGYIGPETKIVFRSASSMVYLFLQMSSEMWDFDINGDLYFEKAVNGFLTDLFERWKKFHCTHDVTIVLFSRTYYEANTIEEFPERMRGCLNEDHTAKNRYYEDYYRVALQNERVDDWTCVLYLLKRLFNEYEEQVVRFHERESREGEKIHEREPREGEKIYEREPREGEKIPKPINSTAAQGNFLEVLNMSLNVFERHHVDRSFDRTGQLSVVISPGVGVFEVDFDLTNITKQRIIDNGIGSDLVCLGEQPLHAVPLFKFNQKESSSDPYTLHAADVYNMPHWINLSFYTSTKPMAFSSFIPRIKMPTILLDKPNDKTPVTSVKSFQTPNDKIPVTSGKSFQTPVTSVKSFQTPDDKTSTKSFQRSPTRHSPTQPDGKSSNSRNLASIIDYDEYDAHVFKVPSHHQTP